MKELRVPGGIDFTSGFGLPPGTIVECFNYEVNSRRGLRMKQPRYENIRAAYIAWVMLLNTGVVWFGLTGLEQLNATSNSFLIFVLGLLNIPVAFYFHDRWVNERVGKLEERRKELERVIETKGLVTREDVGL